MSESNSGTLRSNNHIEEMIKDVKHELALKGNVLITIGNGSVAPELWDKGYSVRKLGVIDGLIVLTYNEPK